MFSVANSFANTYKNIELNKKIIKLKINNAKIINTTGKIIKKRKKLK